MTSDADASGPLPAAEGRPRIGLIWAAAEGVIGRAGGMPWHVPEDLAHFKEVTLGAPVVMGRKTWDSLPARFRPLPGRRNIVVTRDPSWAADGADRASSIDAALELAAESDPDWIWVIGGGELFAALIDRAHRLEVTELDLVVPDGDAFAPPVGPEWRETAVDPSDGWHTSRTGIRHRFRRLER